MKKITFFSIATLFLNLAVGLPIPLGTYSGKVNYFFLDKNPIHAKQFPCTVTFTIELDKKSQGQNFAINNFKNSCPSQAMSWEVDLPTLFLHGPTIFKIDGMGSVSKTGEYSKTEMTLFHVFSKKVGQVGQDDDLFTFQMPINLKALDGELSSAKKLLFTTGSMLTASTQKQQHLGIQYYQSGIVSRTQE